jgi:ankyrin repeat protein
LYGSVKVVKFLHEKGADLNAIGQNGNTALHNAVRFGHYDLVTFLLNNDVRLDIRNSEGKLAIELADDKSKELFADHAERQFDAVIVYNQSVVAKVGVLFDNDIVHRFI